MSVSEEHLVVREVWRNVGTLRPETAREFTAAISVYQRSGFVECGAFGDYNDHTASRFMEKRLI